MAIPFRRVQAIHAWSSTSGRQERRAVSQIFPDLLRAGNSTPVRLYALEGISWPLEDVDITAITILLIASW